MHKLLAALAALRHGASLADPAGWKRRQNTVNALVGLLGAVALFLPVELSDADIEMLAGGVAVLLAIANLYVTTASTDKIGVPARSAPADRPADGSDSDGPADPRIEP